MKLARLVLPFLAMSALAACTADSPTAPALPDAPPSFSDTDCATKVQQVQADGTVIWVCSPGQTGSGG